MIVWATSSRLIFLCAKARINAPVCGHSSGGQGLKKKDLRLACRYTIRMDWYVHSSTLGVNGLAIIGDGALRSQDLDVHRRGTQCSRVLSSSPRGHRHQWEAKGKSAWLGMAWL